MKVLRGGPEYDLILINLDNNIRQNLIMKFSHVNIQLNLEVTIIMVFLIQWVLASIISSLFCSNLSFRSCLSICFETQAWCFKNFPHVFLELLLLVLRALMTYPNASDNGFFYIQKYLSDSCPAWVIHFSVEFFTFSHIA